DVLVTDEVRDPGEGRAAVRPDADPRVLEVVRADLAVFQAGGAESGFEVRAKACLRNIEKATRLRGTHAGERIPTEPRATVSKPKGRQAVSIVRNPVQKKSAFKKLFGG